MLIIQLQHFILILFQMKPIKNNTTTYVKSFTNPNTFYNELNLHSVVVKERSNWLFC
jgi:hypothetical protein